MASFLQEVMEEIVLLQGTIYVTIIVVLVALVAFWIYTSHFAWISRNRRLMGMFYHISTEDSALLASCLMKFALIITLIITQSTIMEAHLLMYIGLIGMYIVLKRKLRDCLMQLFNSGIILVLLYVASFLRSYLDEIVFNRQIFIVYILLLVFAAMYSLYDMVWCVIGIVMDSRKRVEKKGRKKNGQKGENQKEVSS